MKTMIPDQLTRLGFEAVYLVTLTRERLKPLSRLENCSDPEFQAALQKLGLKTRTIQRFARSGKCVPETIFSLSDDLLSEYAARFDNGSLRRDPDAARFEGRLFGYPACCIESFVGHGYAPNGLPREDQSILFHWACPRCQITPALLPHYRQIYAQCHNLYHANRRQTPRPLTADTPGHVGKSFALAASLAAIFTLPQAWAASQIVPADPHWLPVGTGDDLDGDFLTTEEETVLGKDPANADQNRNGRPDGPDLAFDLANAIALLPTEPSAKTPYAIHNLAFGLETCKVCGEMANMGFITIVNPLENQTIDMPYIGLHYLAHGSFQYEGTVHAGRVNPPLLQTVLSSTGFQHFIAEPESYDTDNDALRDWEEPFFNTNPAVRDTDGNGVIDGPEVMRALRNSLDKLPRATSPDTGPKDAPFVVKHAMKGIETCPRCGEQVPMSVWDVINPLTFASSSIPSMALHYLTHGGPSWEGGQLMGGKGRVDPLRLQGILTGQSDGHWLEVPSDTDGDLLSDCEELHVGNNPRVHDENGNQVPDGADLAGLVASEIATLPTTPGPALYRLDFLLRGLERCDVCGVNVNMGHLTVCNPKAELYAAIPFIALHYMEHGSFSFAGDVHGSGRPDLKLLLDTLHSKGPPHFQPASDDADKDGLADFEEQRFGFDKDNRDTNNDGVPDGFHVARQMWTEIEALPRTPNDNCYVVENPLRGLVTCEVCGAQVNMGWIDIVNPHEQITYPLSYLALHHLGRGSFGPSPNTRINVLLLDIALHGNGTSHLVTWPEDLDRDGLLDTEEPLFNTRPDQPDTDGDGVLDGVALARILHKKVQALPVGHHPTGKYRLLFETDCLRPCASCRENINCGHIEVFNEWLNRSMRISFMNLHYLEHGSLAVSDAERIDPVALRELLASIPAIAVAQSSVTLRWPSRTDRRYQIFTSGDVEGPWTPGPAYSGNGDELSFTDIDAAISARKFYQLRMH